jgi:transposase
MGHEQLSETRRRAVAAVQEGQSPEMVAKAHMINRTTIYDWLALYRQGGWNALKAAKRGGRKPRLNGKMLRWVWQTIATKTPLQMRFEFALWTAEMIRALIKKRFKLELSHRSVCRLLNQLGLSVQKPLWKAYQQDPGRVKEWLEKTYPEIRRQAGANNARIYFGDESGVRSDHHAGSTWAPKGKTPVVKTTGARFGFNIISAISPRGQMRFMIFEGKMGAALFIEFLKRLRHGEQRPVYLVVDGHPAHRAKMTSQYVEGTKGALKLFFLPGYSPELNADELVWNNLKNRTLGRKAHVDKEGLKGEIRACLRRIQRLPELVRSFFRKPSTCYAA